MDENGELTTYCYRHDPDYSKEKKDLQKAQMISEALDKFKVGTLVVAKWGGVNYEGIVLEVSADNAGCMVQFEEQ
jgi:hypothetical protein